MQGWNVESEYMRYQDGDTVLFQYPPESRPQKGKITAIRHHPETDVVYAVMIDNRMYPSSSLREVLEFAKD